MLTPKTYAWCLFLCLATSQAGIALADTTPIERANTALAQGDCAQAYALLEPLESVQAGESAFDLLLGQAALKCGHTGRAVFALERILVANPEHSAAQIQLAQAYKKLGETKSARQALQIGLKQATAQDKQLVDDLLNDLDQATAERSRTTAYVELGLGYDSNINAASDTSFGVPGFTRQAAAFANLAAGINFRHAVSPRTAVFASLSGNQRLNNQHEVHDLGILDAQLGFSMRRDDNTFILAFQNGYAFLDSDDYRHVYGLNGRWLHTLNGQNQFMAFAQALRLDYEGQSIRNADRYVGGVKFSHVFTGQMTPVLSVSGYAGVEEEHANSVPYLGHRLAGLRLSGDLTLNSKTTAFWSASYEHRNYGGQDPIWSLGRDDNEYRVSAGINYSPARLWTLRPELLYVRNHSSIEFNDYARTIFLVALRRDFSW